MPKSALTAAAVDKIKAPATGQVDHFDKGYPGLALRVSHGGAKAWVHFYRVEGRQRRRTLGRYVSPDHGMSLKEAREAWRGDRESLAAGIDPAEIVKRETRDDAVATVVAEWLKRDQGDELLPDNRTVTQATERVSAGLYGEEISDDDTQAAQAGVQGAGCP